MGKGLIEDRPSIHRGREGGRVASAVDFVIRLCLACVQSRSEIDG